MESASSMIAIERLSKSFETPRAPAIWRSPTSRSMWREGEFVSILGPSGCGKSTLLYIVGGFVQPSSRHGARRRQAGHRAGPDRGPVFQEFALFPWKTVLGNVMYGLLEQGVPRPRRRQARAR